MPKAAASRHIVILHGWTIRPQVRNRWQPFLTLLSRLQLTVHFWPLPGLQKHADTPHTLDSYVTWLDQQTRSLPPFIVLGHSFGGQLAIRFARLFPQRVRRLILIDSAGIVDRSPRKVLKRAVFGMLAKAGRKLTQSPAFRKLLYRLAREKDYLEASPAQRETMRSILREEVRDDLPALSVPTLIIWGQNDTMTPVALGRVFANGIANSRFILIQGARHSPMYTHPRETADAVADFLKA